MLEHSGEVSGFTAENIVFPEDSAWAWLTKSSFVKKRFGRRRRTIAEHFDDYALDNG